MNPTASPAARDPLVALGERLFFDPLLSGSGTVSCSRCHRPELAFANNRSVSEVYPGGVSGFRNTPTLLAVAMQDRYMRDGRISGDIVEAITEQLVSPLTMAMDSRLADERLQQSRHYETLFAAARLGQPSVTGAARAIAAYLTDRSERAIQETSLTVQRAENAEGRALFFGKAGCADCHFGDTLSDGKVHPPCPEPPGAGAAADSGSCTRILTDKTLPVSARVALSAQLAYAGIPWRTPPRTDSGASAYEDRTDPSFLTPSLIALADTAPYLHDGRAASLESLFDPAISHGLRHRPLDADQISTLLSFLGSLKAPRSAGSEPDPNSYQLSSRDDLAPAGCRPQSPSHPGDGKKC